MCCFARVLKIGLGLFTSCGHTCGRRNASDTWCFRHLGCLYFSFHALARPCGVQRCVGLFGAILCGNEKVCAPAIGRKKCFTTELANVHLIYNPCSRLYTPFFALIRRLFTPIFLYNFSSFHAPHSGLHASDSRL